MNTRTAAVSDTILFVGLGGGVRGTGTAANLRVRADLVASFGVALVVREMV